MVDSDTRKPQINGLTTVPKIGSEFMAYKTAISYQGDPDVMIAAARDQLSARGFQVTNLAPHVLHARRSLKLVGKKLKENTASVSTIILRVQDRSLHVEANFGYARLGAVIFAVIMLPLSLIFDDEAQSIGLPIALAVIISTAFSAAFFYGIIVLGARTGIDEFLRKLAISSLVQADLAEKYRAHE